MSKETSEFPVFMASFDVHMHTPDLQRLAMPQLRDEHGNFFTWMLPIHGLPAFTPDGKPFLNGGSKQARVGICKIPDHIVISTLALFMRSYFVPRARCFFFTKDKLFAEEVRRGACDSFLWPFMQEIKIFVLPNFSEWMADKKRRGGNSRKNRHQYEGRLVQLVVSKLKAEHHRFLKNTENVC